MAAPAGATSTTALFDNVLADLSGSGRSARWSTSPPACSRPAAPAARSTPTVLGYIMEQTTGSSVAELVRQYVTTPLGIDQRQPPTSRPPNSPATSTASSCWTERCSDTASVPTDAYWSFLGAAGSATSTLPDLLDLLDAWVTGELLGADRAATPDKFRPDNAWTRPQPSVGDRHSDRWLL